MDQKISQASSVLILSLVKLLERFSYYGMRALLVVYAMEEFDLSNSKVFSYYGIFTAGIYMVNFPMSLISDLLLKQRNGTFLGFLLLLIGYFILSIPNSIAVVVALVFIALGVGLVNANMIVLLGRFFDKKDKNRNAGFVVYLTAVNIGAFIAALGLGVFAEKFGYALGFMLTGFSALFALIIFGFYNKKFNLIELDDFSKPNELKDEYPEILDYNPNIKEGFKRQTPPPIPGYRSSRNLIGRYLTIMGITFTAIIFWQLYEVSSIQFFDNYEIESTFNLFGMTLPRSAVYSLQSIMLILVSALVFLALLSKKLKSSINMIGIGFLAFSVYLVLNYLGGGDSEITILISLLGMYGVGAIAEVFMTTIALSYITRLNNVSFSSTIVGLYLLLIGLGSSLFSYINFLYEDINLLILAIVPIVLGLVFILGRKLLLQLTGGME